MTTAEALPGGGWRHTNAFLLADHDARFISTFFPPDATGDWERTGRTGDAVRWRHRETGRTATTTVHHTCQTRTVGPWVADGPKQDKSWGAST